MGESSSSEEESSGSEEESSNSEEESSNSEEESSGSEEESSSIDAESDKSYSNYFTANVSNYDNNDNKDNNGNFISEQHQNLNKDIMNLKIRNLQLIKNNECAGADRLCQEIVNKRKFIIGSIYNNDKKNYSILKLKFKSNSSERILAETLFEKDINDHVSLTDDKNSLRRIRRPLNSFKNDLIKNGSFPDVTLMPFNLEFENHKICGNHVINKSLFVDIISIITSKYYTNIYPFGFSYDSNNNNMAINGSLFKEKYEENKIYFQNKYKIENAGLIALSIYSDGSFCNGISNLKFHNVQCNIVNFNANFNEKANTTVIAGFLDSYPEYFDNNNKKINSDQMNQRIKKNLNQMLFNNFFKQFLDFFNKKSKKGFIVEDPITRLPILIGIKILAFLGDAPEIFNITSTRKNYKNFCCLCIDGGDKLGKKPYKKKEIILQQYQKINECHTI